MILLLLLPGIVLFFVDVALNEDWLYVMVGERTMRAVSSSSSTQADRKAV